MLKTKQNEIYFILSLVIIVLMSMLLFSLKKIHDVKPMEYIKGFYQSIEYLPDLYEFSFTEDEFFIKVNNSIVDQGNYERYENNIFVCYGDQDTRLLTLVNDGFYMYDQENKRVIKMLKVSNTPTRLPRND